MHFDLDSHDACTVTDDDPQRMVANPAKKEAHLRVQAARARETSARAAADAALLTARTPAPGRHTATVTNEDYYRIIAPLLEAENALTAHRQLPARVRLGGIAPASRSWCV